MRFLGEFWEVCKVLFKTFIALKYLYISGNKNLHQTLSSATKKSSVLNKAVVQRRYPQKQRDDRASPDRRDRYPSRYRDRSRSPVKNRGRDRGDNSHNSLITRRRAVAAKMAAKILEIPTTARSRSGSSFLKVLNNICSAMLALF